MVSFMMRREIGEMRDGAKIGDAQMSYAARAHKKWPSALLRKASYLCLGGRNVGTAD
jgi:hypothetical protein